LQILATWPVVKTFFIASTPFTCIAESPPRLDGRGVRLESFPPYQSRSVGAVRDAATPDRDEPGRRKRGAAVPREGTTGDGSWVGRPKGQTSIAPHRTLRESLAAAMAGCCLPPRLIF